MTPVSVIVADDHPLVLHGIADFLAGCPNIELLAACQDGQAALNAIREFGPDVAVLDISMPALSGLEVLTALRRANIRTRVIFLSAHLDSRAVMTAVVDEAFGFLLKECSPQQLERCILDAAHGQKHFAVELFDRAKSDDRPLSVIDLLTDREWKVMKYAVDGLPNKEIARTLNVTEGTVKIHLHQIFKKLRVKNRTALANFAFKYRD